MEKILDNQESLMAAQDDVNAAITAIGVVLTDVSAQVSALSSDLAAWVAKQPATVDTSGLAAMVASAQAAQAALDAQTKAITDAVNPAPPAA